MPHNPPGDLHQLPPKRRDRMTAPSFRTAKPSESEKQVVCYHADAKVNRISEGLSARHLILAEADLQLLVEVLRLAALVVPTEHIECTLLFRQVCCYCVMKVLPLVKEILLSPLFPFDHQTKGFFRLVHRMHGLDKLVVATSIGPLPRILR